MSSEQTMMSDKRQIKPEVGMAATIEYFGDCLPGQVINVTHKCNRVVIETVKGRELVFTKRKLPQGLSESGWGEWYYKQKGEEFISLFLGEAVYYVDHTPR